jgi:hypothetical protein
MSFYQAKGCAADWDFSDTKLPAFKLSHSNDLSLPFTGRQYSATTKAFYTILRPSIWLLVRACKITLPDAAGAKPGGQTPHLRLLIIKQS